MSFRRETIVKGLGGDVLVSTIKLPGRTDIETIVFPYSHEQTGPIALFRECDNNPRAGRRTHKNACQKFDYLGREYNFDSRTLRYEPVQTPVKKVNKDGVAERSRRIDEARNSRYGEAKVERLFGRYRITETDPELGRRETILVDMDDHYCIVSIERVSLKG